MGFMKPSKVKTAWDLPGPDKRKSRPDICFTVAPLGCKVCNDTGQVQCGKLCQYFDGRSCTDVDARGDLGCPACPACDPNRNGEKV